MNKLPPEVFAFVRSHIDAVEQLEILLLLRKTADRAWTAEGVRDELRSGLDSVTNRLFGLEQRGLVRAEELADGRHQYRYAPRTPELARAVDMVFEAYSTRRYAVIDAIFSRPIDKLQGFASAFRFRKDDPDGSDG